VLCNTNTTTQTTVACFRIFTTAHLNNYNVGANHSIRKFSDSSPVNS